MEYENVVAGTQMQPDEIQYMLNLISELPIDGSITEWGCGGSTCHWLSALQDTQKLITIEHKHEWYVKVKRAILEKYGELPSNFEFNCIRDQYLDHGYGSPVEEMPMGTAAYINPNDAAFNANIYFIDGIARAACALTVLLKHKKENPVILIHDYVSRESWYDWATQFFDVEIVGTTLARLYMK